MEMREILFRGKNRYSGEWFEGYLEYFTTTSNRLVCYRSVWGKQMHEVYPDTVGQYTGLKDRNGRRIFEGDIVESEFTKRPYLVCFGKYTYTNEYGEEESACGWYNEEKGGYETAFGSPDAWATVIGNIHDNPELLEET